MSIFILYYYSPNTIFFIPKYMKAKITFQVIINISLAFMYYFACEKSMI